MPNPFCHIVIPAPDLSKAKLFYEVVFGWRVREGVPGPNYWFFESGNVGGAFDKSRRPAIRSVLLHIRVDDMEAALKSVEDRGGKVTRGRSRTGEASPGFDAHILDPNGNEIGLYSER
jgi:predicted enzyme related to lactoylglutathione lyase